MEGQAFEQYPCDAAVLGESLFVATSSLTGERWTGSLLVNHSPLALPHGLSSLAPLSPSLLAAGGDSPALLLFALHNDAARQSAALAGHSAPIAAVARLADGVVSASADMRSIFWDVKTQTPVQSEFLFSFFFFFFSFSFCLVYDVHEHPITLAASHGDQFASYSSFDRTLHLFSSGSCSSTHSLATPSEATALAFNPAGNALLVGLYSGAVLTYDVRNLSAAASKETPHIAAVRRFAFHKDRIISGEIPLLKMAIVVVFLTLSLLFRSE